MTIRSSSGTSRIVANETRGVVAIAAAAEGSPFVSDVPGESRFEDELHEIPATAIAHEGDAAPVLPFEVTDSCWTDEGYTPLRGDF